MATRIEGLVVSGLAAVWLVGPLHEVEVTQASVQFEITGPTTVSQHMPLVAEYHITNAGDRPLRVNAGWNRVGSFRFQLTLPDGVSIAARPSSPPLGGISALEQFDVKPGEQYEEWIVLNQWLDLSQVGSYDLLTRFDGSITSLGRAVEVDREWRQKITILPRNEGELRRAAARLREAALTGFAITERRAATALAHMNDPVAVPYLVDVIGARKSTGIAIDGLVRIGGSDARRALEKLATSEHAETASLARDALKRIK